MTVNPMLVTAVEIRDVPSLDPILVYWNNCEPSQGYVTLVCWGCAWSCYFRAMSGKTIREFFAYADTPYLVNKLGNTQFLKQTKQHEKYLTRIVEAVKAHLAQEKEAAA